MKINKALLGGSIILLITINLYNALNFGFQWSMARILSILDYRELATLISIIYIIAVFTESMQIVIAKYTSIQKNEGAIKNLLKRGLRKSFFLAIIAFLIYTLIAIPLSSLLKIELSLMMVNGILIFPLFFTPITRGILQGKKKFKAFGFNLIAEGIVKIGLGILFVFLGFKVYGAIIAIIIAIFFSFGLSFITLKKTIISKEKNGQVKNIKSYTGPVIFINLSILAFASLDIIIAGIVFSEEIAGFYTLSSVIAKSILLATNPIGKALFPLSSDKINKKKNPKKLTRDAFLILISLIILALPFFYFFPELLIKIFSGRDTPESAKIIFNLAIGFSFISIGTLSLYSKMSHGFLNIKTLIKYCSTLIIGLLMVLSLFLTNILDLNLVNFSIGFILTSLVFLLASFSIRNQIQ